MIRCLVLTSIWCSHAADTQAPAPAAFIMLHGSGGTGRDLESGFNHYVDGGKLAARLAENNVAVHFPTAEPIFYSPAGYEMNVWYNRDVGGLDPDLPEDTASIESSMGQVLALLEQIRSSGIPASRTILGGWSQGGGMALQVALRHPELVAAAYALSSYFCTVSAVYDLIPNNPAALKLPILMVHGTVDTLVPMPWGKTTATNLQELGVPVHFEQIEGKDHSLLPVDFELLDDFVFRQLNSSGHSEHSSGSPSDGSSATSPAANVKSMQETSGESSTTMTDTSSTRHTTHGVLLMVLLAQNAPFFGPCSRA
eukprot:gnl/TRDRNA2_/TRDRNA2_198859_c0_seq1.p1 gnl/TRDRNA2_/TRDRNA2_198859_c0~~gnl/TRDRNA2_/TRDRNA2_198859_c0_seq1.p1  ORF type:complete len:311 (+),score=45.56 gnl/TRDRNA2_/TRDRNA2_198859_c0_seq1:131-1063(+)